MRKNQTPEEWEDDDETSSEEGEGVEEERISNAQRGRVRLHGVMQSSAGLEVDDDPTGKFNVQVIHLSIRP
eukprot:scaffold40039_cov67-Phaeocystis_antarctica.AAC.1